MTAPFYIGGDFTVESEGVNATFSARAHTVDSASAIAEAPLLNGAVTYDLFVSTGSDILVFDFEVGDAMNTPDGWFNDSTKGIDTGPSTANSARALHYDSWVATPGETWAVPCHTPPLCDVGLGIAPVGATVVSDSTNDGPQDDFHFAKVTVIPDAQGSVSTTIRGVLQTSHRPTPLFDTFEYRLKSGNSFDVAGNISVGAVIGTVAARDPEGGDLEYSILSGDRDFFSYGASDGRIKTRRPLTPNTSYSLVVQARDAEGLTASSTIQINAGATASPTENRAPEFGDTDDLKFRESMPAGTVIGRVAATDPDGDAVTHVIASGNQDGLFSYDAVSGTLRTAREVTEADDFLYRLVLRASDDFGNSTTTIVSIDSIPGNHAPEYATEFDTIVVDIDTGVGTTLGVYTAFDLDGDDITYEFADVSSNQDFFSYLENGELRIVKHLSGLEVGDFLLVLTATDPHGLSDLIAIHVSVPLDGPVFEAVPDTTVSSRVPIGTLVHTVKATDPKGDELQYSLVGGNAINTFSFDETTGEVRTQRGLNARVIPDYHLQLQATNSAGDSSETTILIDVLEETLIWHNHANPLDTTGDGVIAPVDVITVINELNYSKHSDPDTGLMNLHDAPPAFVDVSGDWYVSAIDALKIINKLNEPAVAQSAMSTVAEEQSPLPQALPILDTADSSTTENEEESTAQLVDMVFGAADSLSA